MKTPYEIDEICNKNNKYPAGIVPDIILLIILIAFLMFFTFQSGRLIGIVLAEAEVQKEINKQDVLKERQDRRRGELLSNMADCYLSLIKNKKKVTR